MTDHRPRSLPLCTCGKPAVNHRPKHAPTQWPICSCGAESARHRVKHKADGDPCSCGLARVNHVKRSPCDKRQEYTHPFVGIDGEGIGRNPHRYVYLAAANDLNKHWHVENPNGLTTRQCLDFLLGLPNCRLFGYAFGYDLTKMLQDIGNETLYRLMRPSMRHRSGKKRMRGPREVQWRGYRLNWLNGKFSVRRGKTRRVIWDLYKFYQSTFVTALERWDIGDPEYIQSMKVRRSQFSEADMPEIKRYCLLECHYLAMMARELIETHNKVGLRLTSYYGPGSTASVALRQMGVRDMRGEQPERMRDAIARAFFGGRFEHSVMGMVR